MLRNRVRALRVGADLTVAELASRSGVERHILGKIDRDEGYEPSFRTARKLADVFGVPVETLFWSEPDEPSGDEPATLVGVS